MAHTLLPAAGQSLVKRQEEFSFQKMNEIKEERCLGYECENIPPYLYHYKCSDYSKEAPCPHQQQGLSEPQHQVYSSQGPRPNVVGGPQWHPHGMSRTNIYKNQQYLGGHNQLSAPFPSHLQHQQGMKMGRDQKKPTIPMSNCQPLNCCGTSCACLAPEDALWGHTVHDVSTCAWTQGRETSKLRVPDPQVVRPHDKTLPEDMRPTGHPYFTHGRKTCPPHEAPIAKSSGFNFEQWLATTKDREPPEHLKNKCISSMCTMCGPLTVECCPGYQCPQNYMIAKLG